eukprot:UN09274
MKAQTSERVQHGQVLCCGYLSCSEFFGRMVGTKRQKHIAFHGIPKLPQAEFTWGKVLGQGA